METHDASKLNDAGGVGINPDSAIPRMLSVGTDRAKTKPRPTGGGAKFCGVIRASLGGNLGTSLHLQLQIESDNSELVSGTGPLPGDALGLSQSPPNKHYWINRLLTAGHCCLIEHWPGFSLSEDRHRTEQSATFVLDLNTLPRGTCSRSVFPSPCGNRPDRPGRIS